MKLTKCERGHFFDGDKYASCPFCAQGGGNNPTVAIMNDQDNDKTIAAVEDVSTAGKSLLETLTEASVTSAPVYDDDDDGKTVRLGQVTAEDKQPVVGWLVGLNGEAYGESFPLVSGKNFIGRDRNMDVVLQGDPSVSRQKHAILIYEPRGRLFLVQSGESRELFYLNDKVVLNNQEIQKGDILSVGNTKLLFVPLCDGNFSWEDVKEEKKDE